MFADTLQGAGLIWTTYRVAAEAQREGRSSLQSPLIHHTEPAPQQRFPPFTAARLRIAL